MFATQFHVLEGFISRAVRLGWCCALVLWCIHKRQRAHFYLDCVLSKEGLQTLKDT